MEIEARVGVLRVWSPLSSTAYSTAYGNGLRIDKRSKGA